MKKFYIMALSLCLLAGYSTMANAGTANNNVDGAIIVDCEAGACKGGGLTFTPSPKVQLYTATAEAGYALTSANTLTTQENGLEYGIISTQAGYYQRVKTTAAGTGPAAPTDSATLNETAGAYTYIGSSS